MTFSAIPPAARTRSVFTSTGLALNPSFSGGDFFAQSCASQSNVPLATGVNYLYAYQRDTGSTTSGIILSATITVPVPPNPHILTVNSTNDVDDGVCDAVHCSLREAINAANNQAGADTIRFAIPGAAPYTIQPTSALPILTTSMAIDATTQPGFAGTPVVVLDGTGAGSTRPGLRIDGPDVLIKGFDVQRFASGGIGLWGTNGTVGLCYVGTDVTGTLDRGNGTDGVSVLGSGNRVGSPTLPNLVSGNGGPGISVSGANHVVEGNRVGTNAAGTAAIPNDTDGIAVSGSQVSSPGNRVGGSAAGAGNLVSGNIRAGIVVSGGFATGTIVQGNRVGTNANGDAALPNGTRGIEVNQAASGTVIGGSNTGEGNLVSGNTSHGIFVFDGQTTGTVIKGNRIGTSADGTAAIPNLTGIVLNQNSLNTFIGGTQAGDGNQISGNRLNAISIGLGSHGNVVEGNRIGTDPSGLTAVPNVRDAGDIRGAITVSATNNRIGGSQAGACNVIAGNGGTGVEIAGGQAVQVLGNRIGANAGGQPLPNGAYGMMIYGGAGPNPIGGIASGEGNEIAHNAAAGVWVLGNTTFDNRIEGNSIHDNGGLGIDLEGEGIDFNDNGDQDGGGNGTMNFPLLTSATLSGAGLAIAGTLSSFANEPCRVCFYANAACDPSGCGEGTVFLGTTDVTTNGSGQAVISVTLPVLDLGGNLRITATTSDSFGSTSEFSPCVVAQTPPADASDAPGSGRPSIVLVGPNPGPTATLRLVLPTHGDVRIDVLDVGGRRVRTILSGQEMAGSRDILWDGRDDTGAHAPSGVYFLRMEAAGAVGVCQVAIAR